MIREVVLEPHSILRRIMPAAGIANKKELARIFQDLTDTMNETGAVGFAANQIGEEVSICIVKLGNNKVLELINPLLLKRVNKFYSVEACMSIPNYSAIIPRFEEVTIGYLNRDGKARTISLAAPYSVRAQHEIDHLNGILIRDYVEGKNGKSGGLTSTEGTIR